MLTCVMHVMTTYSGHPFFMVQFYNAPANEYQAYSNRNPVYNPILLEWPKYKAQMKEKPILIFTKISGLILSPWAQNLP